MIRRIPPPLLLVLAILILPRTAAASGDGSSAVVGEKELAEIAWEHRDRGFEEGQLDPTPTRQAIRRWEALLIDNPEDPDIPFQLIEGLWFQAAFLETDRRRQGDLADRIVDLAEDALARQRGAVADSRTYPVRAEFWAAVGWGFWGMCHSNLASARRGVAARVRDHAARLVELDPAWADGGGHRLLGRLHTVAPRVPFFSGWIDRQVGIEHLEQALETSHNDPRNLLFLAEALLEYRPERRTEALDLLRVLSRTEPALDQRVEQDETLREARRRLASETGAEELE